MLFQSQGGTAVYGSVYAAAPEGFIYRLLWVPGEEPGTNLGGWVEIAGGQVTAVAIVDGNQVPGSRMAFDA